jgi:glycosyltransferase involved in cell wall biosynthesis
MRVCIDIQAGIAQLAGVGRYTRELVTHLGPLAAPDELSLFYFDFQRGGRPFPVNGAADAPCRWLPGRFIQGAWKTIGWPPYDLLAGAADVYHFPNFIRPPLRRGRSVVTIHDVAFLRHPETIEPGNYRHLKARIRETVERSDAIITVSSFTAREIEALLNVPADRIHPIASGLSGTMRRASDEATARVRQALGLERPYLLSVGTLEPRKNYPFLVDVFERLGGFDGDLVVAGMRGWKDEPILARMRDSPRGGSIRYLQYVPDGDLPALYSGASLFVCPSLYEGFGFPPLEAMACGTPVVSSSAGSLPEVLGEDAVLLDGFDAETWAGKIEALLQDSSTLAALAARGPRRAAQFSWEETARKTWQIYRTLGGSR